MTCPTCSAANPAGAKFCVECGTRLAAACPSCGATTNPPGARFCAECGTRLDGGSATVGSGSPAGPAGASVPAPVTLGEPGPFQPVEPQTERRLVTVLFADLVGFTTRADSADPEQVREFLSRYFELCQETVERYGGTVEKFIGDAVMALWGAPVAREDDAERAVRAALELVDAVRHLGKREGDETLQVRAGVLTGEAAVAIGATNQGMVAGDLVNTASRLQSVAPPGTVLVGEAPRRAASSAIAFEAAGEQLLKGKPAPVEAFRALRVVAERGGTGRSEGIEAPFVGRDDELRLIKDFLHATSRERRVRLLSVTGQGGIGKSRLAWEFLKYIDGVEEDIFWHQGRSPSFGEGVTFWALGEMVRRRAGLAETDDDATTLERLAATVAEFVPDEGERRRIEPALRSLLGIGDAPPGGREELFAAWRTFFERISLQGTTVLVFEDLQWADAGLLDFIDHVLEWSIGYPILVVTLARPDLIERRPDWGAGRRNFVALALQPLSDDAMRELLDGLVPGLPSSAVRTILQRADGIPLYAVETIRMLVEDGKLAEADGAYEVTDDLGELQIPDTLHALIAARLDAVDPSDRALLQDGAVLGQTFSVAALAALTGEPEASLEPRLRALVHREILQLDTDPRSPERGQYGFTQALVREVAYSTLAKRDRRTRHLAAARYYESLGDEAAAGVLAMHYVDAYEAAPEGAEGEAVATQARIALRAAADRATALGSHESALAYLERARAVTSDPSEEAALLESLGTEAREAGRHEAAIKSFTEAVGRHRALGDLRSAARATTGLAIAQYAVGRFAEPLALLEAAEPEVAHLAPDPVVVDLWIALARLAGADQEARLRGRHGDGLLFDRSGFRGRDLLGRRFPCFGNRCGLRLWRGCRLGLGLGNVDRLGLGLGDGLRNRDGLGLRLGLRFRLRLGLRLGLRFRFRLGLRLGFRYWLGLGLRFWFRFRFRLRLGLGLGFRYGPGLGRTRRSAFRPLIRRATFLANLGQFVEQRRIDDDHRHGVFGLEREFRGTRFFHPRVVRRQLDVRVVGDLESCVGLLYAIDQPRDGAHGLARDDQIAHAVQLVDAALQQVLDRGRCLDAPVADRNQQCLDIVAQAPHCLDARHARTALERVQVALELLHGLRAAFLDPGQ